MSAASSIEAGLRLEPDNPGALFDLGNAYYKLNRYEDAIASYENAAEQDAKFWPAVNNIGLVLYESGDVEEAISKWREALEIATEEEATEPQLAIAVALYAKGDHSQAISLGMAALERDSRYADLDFLVENLWGVRLLAETEQFFSAPAVRALIAQL